MALTPSNMLALGTPAPDFHLPDSVSGKTFSRDELLTKKANVVIFMCNHCPYVIHLHQGLTSLIKHYTDKSVSFVAISSNDIENYPQDGPEHMKPLAEKLQFDFPYLYDETQNIARAYEAACTPDFYVFDQNQRCVYRGQFDDSRPGNNKSVTGKDLSAAIDSVLEDRKIPEPQVPSMGCNIKWKS